MTGKTKLLHLLATSHLRGAERFCLQLAKALEELGVSQEIAVLEGDGAFPQSDIKISAVNQGGGGTWKRIASLRALIRDQSPSVILCHGLTPLKFARLATLGLRSPPSLVIKKIGLTAPWMRRFGILQVLSARWAMSGASACVVLGPTQADEARTLLKVPDKKLVHIPNARQRPVLQPSISRRQDLVLVVGALSEEKVPEVALGALRRLHDDGMEAKLRFVGSGPLLEALRDEAVDLGLEHHVEFAGQVDSPWAHYQEASLLLICSRTEGVPGVAIEAAFSGLPVVTWDVGDVRAVVEHDVTGIVTPYGDRECLVDAVRLMLLDNDLRFRLGDDAAGRASQYDMDVVARQYLVLIRDVLDRSTKG